MRENIVFTLIAAAGVAMNAYVGEWPDALIIVAIWAVAATGIWSLNRAGRRARGLLDDETRPMGVTVFFEGVLEPVRCEVVADPDGEHDEDGNPLGWVARPRRIPEGAGPIRSYSVARLPMNHSMAIEVDRLH